MYGICHLSIIPLRADSTSKSELVSQLIYGEFFKVLKNNGKWFYIESFDDNYKGWINHTQFKEISENNFKKLKTVPIHLNNINSEIKTENGKMFIIIGSKISSAFVLNHKLILKSNPKTSIIENSMKFINSPYLWGGRSPYGIDCSGFTQQVFKLNGYQLFRDANQQALQGKEIKLKKSKPGDLAFFGQNKITHVGILMNLNKIIHAFGSIRIDYINEKGIINSDSNKLTHHLKKIVTY